MKNDEDISMTDREQNIINELKVMLIKEDRLFLYDFDINEEELSITIVNRHVEPMRFLRIVKPRKYINQITIPEKIIAEHTLYFIKREFKKDKEN